jgi:hypothetical protein
MDLGSMTSPRTSLDLNFSFQKATSILSAILWQPSIITFSYCIVKCFSKLSRQLFPRFYQPIIHFQFNRGKALYPVHPLTSTPHANKIHIILQIDFTINLRFSFNTANHRWFQMQQHPENSTFRACRNPS